MNLWDIQSTVVDLLKARSEFAPLLPSAALAAGAILPDDGSYPKTPGREEALRTVGLCLVVLEPESEDTTDTSKPGASLERVMVTVLIDYRRDVALQAGLALNHFQALAHARRTLQGKPSGPANNNQRMQPDNPPWSNYGKIGGDNRLTLDLVTTQPIFP